MQLDNRWVVPYNESLSLMFNCNINVEIVSTVKAVKYLYKYVYKGMDKISYKVMNTQVESGIIQDEISDFQTARYLSSSEAIWRLYSFPLHEEKPSVYRLPVHLPHEQYVSFCEQDDLQEVLRSTKKTKLAEFFTIMNKEDIPSMRYQDMPKFYTWNSTEKKWIESKRNIGAVVIRMYHIAFLAGEQFYLRLLLNYVRSPKFFADLRYHNG